LLASIIVEETVLCSSLFIKCFTIDWTRSSVTELIKYLDIVLEWNEDFFKDFTKEFINFLKQDLAIVTAKASKLNSLSPEFQINTGINHKKESENNDEKMSTTTPATVTAKHETKSQKSSDSMEIVPENEEKVSSLSNNSRDGSQYEYFDSVTISNQNASETSMQVEHEEDHQYTEDAMMVDEDQDESEFQEVQEHYNDHEYGGEESGAENNGATITIKPSYSNDFESCMSNSYASTSVTSISSDYREYQGGDDVINSEDEEIIRIDSETGEVIEEEREEEEEEEEEKGDVVEEEEVIKEEGEDKEKIVVEEEEEEVIQEEIICQEDEINDKGEEDHMLRDEEEEIIEVEEEIAYTRLDDNEDHNENNESISTKNKGKEEEITNEEEEIPEEIVVEEEEEEEEDLSTEEIDLEKQRLKEEEESNAQLRLEYKKKLKEKEDTINKIKENKKKSQELLSKLVKLYKANLTLTHYKILLADYQLNAAAAQLNEIKKRISNDKSEEHTKDEGTSSSSPPTISHEATITSPQHSMMNIDPKEEEKGESVEIKESSSIPDTTTTNNNNNNNNSISSVPTSMTVNDPSSDPMDISPSTTHTNTPTPNTRTTYTNNTTTTPSILPRVPVPPPGSASLSSTFHHLRYMQRLNANANAKNNEKK